jgi:hypothetical protein
MGPELPPFKQFKPFKTFKAAPPSRRKSVLTALLESSRRASSQANRSQRSEDMYYRWDRKLCYEFVTRKRGLT